MLPKLIRTRRFGDARGWFSESYNAERLRDAGIADVFVQDNHSFSGPRFTLRGLHFQAPPHAQAKLVRCAAGQIFDVAVDCRRGSPSFGQSVGAVLSAAGGEQLYVPIGFAHGFLTLTENVEVLYKASDFYAPQSEGAVAWDDPALGIAWPLSGVQPVLSDKDAAASGWDEVSVDFSYTGDPLGALEEVAQ